MRAALTAKFRQGGNILHCQAIGKHLTDLLRGFIEGPDQLKAAVPEQVVLPDEALAAGAAADENGRDLFFDAQDSADLFIQ